MSAIPPQQPAPMPDAFPMMNAPVPPQKKPFYKRVWFIVLMVLLGLGILGSMMGGNSAHDGRRSAIAASEQSASEAAAQTAPTVESAQSDPSEQKEEAAVPAEQKEEAPAPVEQPEPEPKVPAEYISALRSAESYSKTLHMSKAGIYDQLVSEYGEKFTPEAAQYAVDNVKADWNKNALEQAKNYQEVMAMSPAAIKDQLVSEYGEKFTEEEAQYAIDHLE